MSEKTAGKGDYQGPDGSDRVLVVDDEEFVRDVLVGALASEFRVAQVTTGEEALAVLGEDPPDIMLVDKNLPNMSGIALLGFVKEKFPDIEVLVITAYASVESVIQALRLGAFDYLTKPFDHVNVVVEKVRRASEKRRLHDGQRRFLEAEKQLRMLEGAVASSISAIGITDIQGSLLYVNDACVKMWGYDSVEEIIGRDLPEFFEGDGVYNTMRLLREHGEARGDDIGKRKDGSLFTAQFAANVIRDEEGNPAYMFGSFLDISEEKKIRARLAQSDRMASVGVLAAGVAHEINNPLSYVLYNMHSLAEDLPKITAGLSHAWSVLTAQLGPARALEVLGEARPFCERGLLDEVVEMAQEAEEGAIRIRNIVRDLKTFAHSDEDRRVPVHLNQVVESAINMAYNEIKFRARLVKEYGDIPLVLASEGRLSQVFLNLLINAAHSIDEGDVEGNEIRVRTWSDKKEVVVEVLDTGRGIPAGHLERLFDPFFTTKPVGVGSGLGLSICHNIITSYGGKLEVESSPDQGSRFTVRLPQPRPEEGIVAESEVFPMATGHQSVRGRILVVDDEPMIGSTVKRVLKGAHDVEVVLSGQAAQERIASGESYDLILCDLMMPGVSGMDLYGWLKQRHPLLARRTVFITGGAFTPRAMEFLRQVPNLTVEKPFDPKNLQVLVRELMVAHRENGRAPS